MISLGGLQGKLFAPLGFAYIYSILASLLVALTLTPALSAVLLNERALKQTEPKWLLVLKHVYEKVLNTILVKPKKIILFSICLIVAAVAMIPFFGGEFLPEFQEGHFVIHMSAIPGTSLEESMRIGKKITAELLKLPEVKTVAQQVGRAERADDTWGPHYSEIQVDLKPLSGDDAEAIQAKIRNALAQFPGISFAVKTVLSERIEETISGSTAQIVVQIFGEDLDVLDQKAKEVSALISKLQGAADVQMESQPSVPELTVKLNLSQVAKFGFQPSVVLDAIQTAYQGAYVSQIYEGNRVFDVVVILQSALRRDPEMVGELLLRNPDGAWVKLKDVADIKQVSGRYAIMHENAHRRQAVTCNVAGRDIGSFTNELKRTLTAVSFPLGTYPLVTGAGEAQSKARQDLFVKALMAMGGIVLLLWIVFKSGRNLALVLSNLPFALVGGVLAVFLTGGSLSLGSLIGFVTLFGITTRNSIMLISHFEHLVVLEGKVWNLETALHGASERLVPILMTALVTALGLLPLAIGSGEPGREIEGPMAIVILGGLLTSTVLNLLVLPTLALRFGYFHTSSSVGLEAP